MANLKVNVVVQPQEASIVIPKGGTFDGKNPPPLAKPKLPLRLFLNVHKSSHDGKLEFTFEGKI